MAGQCWKKRTLQNTFFASILTIARQMSKTKGKNTGKMCRLIFLKIYQQQQKQ